MPIRKIEKPGEKSSGFSCFRLLTPTLLTVAVIAGSASPSYGRVPITNDQRWTKYFSAKELADSEAAVGKSIRLLDKKGTDESATLAEIASHGTTAIPALVKLCGEREMGLLAGSHGGPVPLPIYYPKCPDAEKALTLITEPASKPRLFKIMNDSYMGAAAMLALLNIGGLSGPELTSMIDAPRGVRYQHETLVKQRILELVPDERAALLIHLIRTTGSARGGGNVVAESDMSIRTFTGLMDMLAETPSRIAQEDLKQRALGYRRELNEALNDSHSEKAQNFYSSEGKRKIREKIDKLPGLISIADNELARCSLALGDSSGLVAGPPITELDSEKAAVDTYTLRFLVWSTSPTVKISALIRGIPIDDIQKNIWDIREVKLNRGEVYPYELPMDIRWVPIVKPDVGYPVTIEIYSDKTLIGKMTVYPGFIPGPPSPEPKNAPPPGPPTITPPY